ncbi:patatin-like phospholipase family protein, partial [Hoylesella nanceiensis]
FKNPATFEMVTTNCLTGEAMYLVDKQDKQRTLDIVKASSSLPYVSKIVTVDGIPMLDGGIVDSIPVLRAIETGHPTNVVVLTRNRGYRNTSKDYKIPRFIYKKYPRLRVALSRRVAVYNAQLDLIEHLENVGKIVCIRPIHSLEVDRIERDVTKLEDLYEEGFEQGELFCRQYWDKK